MYFSNSKLLAGATALASVVGIVSAVDSVAAARDRTPPVGRYAAYDEKDRDTMRKLQPIDDVYCRALNLEKDVGDKDVNAGKSEFGYYLDPTDKKNYETVIGRRDGFQTGLKHWDKEGVKLKMYEDLMDVRNARTHKKMVDIEDRFGKFNFKTGKFSEEAKLLGNNRNAKTEEEKTKAMQALGGLDVAKEEMYEIREQDKILDEMWHMRDQARLDKGTWTKFKVWFKKTFRSSSRSRQITDMRKQAAEKFLREHKPDRIISPSSKMELYYRNSHSGGFSHEEGAEKPGGFLAEIRGGYKPLSENSVNYLVGGEASKGRQALQTLLQATNPQDRRKFTYTPIVNSPEEAEALEMFKGPFSALRRSK